MAKSTLAGYLNELYARYDKKYLSTDPIQFPHRYSNPQDQEIVALLACLFAFGNVRSVLATVERILAPLGPRPASTLQQGIPPPLRGGGKGEGATLYPNFVHRWVTREDLLALLLGVAGVLREWGSLHTCFLAGYAPAAPDIGPALSTFVRQWQQKASDAYCEVIHRGGRGLQFLLTDPATGSACKRLNMFLRAVVRPKDGIDLGLWPEVRPAQLIIPLDTHVARISRFLGLTRRRTTNWAMAVEVTHALQTFAPDDPVKYDFALSRIGIVEGCRGYRHRPICTTCPLDAVCQAPMKML